MRFECDWCGEQFDDPEDCSGDACNRCEEGIVQNITEDEVDSQSEVKE